MSRKSKRKNRNRPKHRSSATSQPQPADVESRLHQLFDTADAEPNPHLALELFRTILDGCQHGAAVSVFDDDHGSLWDIPEAQCYLRALFGVAASLWQLNRTEEAARHFEEILQADTADHQFARYWLAACLLTSGQFDKAKPLFDRYHDATAFWRYAQALWTFATGGDSDASRNPLQEARKLDSRFVDYVLGDSLVHADEPVRFEHGLSATHSTARLLLPAWRSVPGAASWMRRALRVPLEDSEAEPPFPREQLLGLPQQDSTWQVGLYEMPADEPGDLPCWLLGVADVRREQLRCMTVIEGTPTPVTTWRAVLSAFLQPMESDPACPLRLEVPRPEYRRAWRPMLDEIGVECRVKYRPQPVTQLLEAMSGLVAARRLPQFDPDFDPRNVPRSDETWQIDFFHQPMVITNEVVGAERPWSVLIMEKESNEVICTEIVSGGPDPERLWEYAVRTMQHLAGCPRRIEVADSDGYDFLRTKLTKADVECVLRDELPELHAFCLQMAASFGGPEKCALTDGEDVDRDAMESFYYAAASYFRQAPWKHVEGEIPIQIDVAGFGTRYAIVLGRTGVTLGLAVHESWQDATDMIAGRASWSDLSGFAVIFEEETVLAPADVYLVERYGWPIASAEAYPAVMRFRPGYEPGSPSADELDFLICCLHCIPGFVAGDEEEQTCPRSDDGLSRQTRVSWASGSGGHPSSASLLSRILGGSSSLDQFGDFPAWWDEPAEPRERDEAVDAVQHVNRKGDIYYLHQGQTKTGKPKYFFSRYSDKDDLCNELPDGFEIHENPGGQVYCRRIPPKLITDEEIDVLREAIHQCGKQFLAIVDVKKKDLIVFEREHPCLKFTLCDEERRLFEASRWCYRGGIDDWFELFSSQKPLPELAKKYCRHIGEESFFELM